MQRTGDNRHAGPGRVTGPLAPNGKAGKRVIGLGQSLGGKKQFCVDGAWIRSGPKLSRIQRGRAWSLNRRAWGRNQKKTARSGSGSLIEPPHWPNQTLSLCLLLLSFLFSMFCRSHFLQGSQLERSFLLSLSHCALSPFSTF